MNIFKLRLMSSLVLILIVVPQVFSCLLHFYWVYASLVIVVSNLYSYCCCKTNSDNFCAINMLYYPMTHVICGLYRYKWKSNEIQDFMKHLHLENMIMILLSKSLNKSTSIGTRICSYPYILMKSISCSYVSMKCSYFLLSSFLLLSDVYMEELIPVEFIEKWSNTPNVHESLYFSLKNSFTYYV